MKKFIALILVFSIVFSLVPTVTSFGAEDYKILFEDNFDEDKLDYPQNWEFVNNNDKYSKANMYLQSKISNAGKALYAKDDSEKSSVQMFSPFIPVKPGKLYTLDLETYVEYGHMTANFIFYAEDKVTALDVESNSNSADYWNPISISMIAPEGAAYCRIKIGTISYVLAEGYFDNICVLEGVRWPTKPDVITPAVQNASVNGKLIEPAGDKLTYHTYSEKGDKLADFSYAGFYQGKYELPDSSKIKVVATIEPSSNKKADDTKRIQKIIDDVYENAPNNYFKVIKLKAGRYNINSNGLNLKSGIILSGEGQGPNGTIIYATDTKRYNVVKIYGSPNQKTGDNHKVLDSYIPSGSNTITLSSDDIKNYKVGDLITFSTHNTDKWNEAMEMKGITNPDGVNTSWDEGEFDSKTERTITEISGNTLTLDIPFFIPYDTSLLDISVYKTDDSGRIEHAGIENLRIETYFNGVPTDEEHADVAIDIMNARNCYVRDVSTKYFTIAAVQFAGGAKQVTVKNCSYLEPVSTNEGSRRYSFCIGPNTQQCLVTECYTYDGRHDYVASGAATGPSAFVNSVSDSSNANSETHGLWSTGILYDNFYGIGQKTNALGSPNYGTLGSQSTPSFGWTGGGIVFYNCLSPAIITHKPPMTYQNFTIGMWGMYTHDYGLKIKSNNIKNLKTKYKTNKVDGPTDLNFATSDNTSFIGDAYKEAETTPVEPRSLFKAQLAERITGNFKNTKPNAPIISTPRGEEEHKVDNKFTIEGLYERGAEEVNIYIDNVKYEANLDKKDFTFDLAVELEDGVHKIYATQTINGVESTKCADRFVVVNTIDTNNPEYLQSNYEYDKIHQLINDDVMSFDEYQAPFAELQPEVITVKIGESMLVTDVDPVEMNGRVLVPMRAIFETFEADVSWDEATATATAVRGDTVIQVTENNQMVKVNGQDVWLDVPATIINGRFVVPVRFISETFGADVGWIDARRMVTIKGAAPLYVMDNGLENEINIYGVTQSADNGAGATIDKAFDKSIDTMWTFSTLHEKGAWGIFDFGFARDIKDAYIAFGVGTQRIHTFDIYVSNDGVNYTLVNADYKSSGNSLELEKFSVNARGRYLKIVGKGNQSEGKQQWNNYSEITFTQNK